MKKIMVVDNEPDIVDLTRTVLEIGGYNVVPVYSGEECLRMLDKEPVDLVLLDIMMPGITVDDVVKQIKDIKIAFMSVVRISDARKRGLTEQDNVVDFFQKPFNVSDLIDRVGLLLNG